jgi:hypothetical protein
MSAVRLGVSWVVDARSDLRRVDRETAVQILQCIDRYLATRTGDVKKLKPPGTGIPPAMRRLPCVLR